MPVDQRLAVRAERAVQAQQAVLTAGGAHSLGAAHVDDSIARECRSVVTSAVRSRSPASVFTG